jgi:hypothetical protein
MQLTSAGNPVISYFDGFNSNLMIAICSNPTCSTATIRTVDNARDVGEFTSLRLTTANNPVVAYYDGFNGNLNLVACTDTTCATTPTPRVLDNTGDVGQHVSLRLSAAGNPIMSYLDVSNSNLKLAVCTNPTCSTTPTLRTLDSTDAVGWWTSLQLASSGNPVIAYYDNSNGNLKLAVCSDATCSANPFIRTVDSSGTVGQYASLQLTALNVPVIAYYDAFNKNLKIAVCTDATCSSPTIRTIDSAGSVGEYASLQLSSTNNPMVSYYDEFNKNLMLAVCSNPTCSATPTIRTIDSGSSGDVGQYTSMRMTTTGSLLIAYYDVFNTNLKLAIVT